MANAESVDILIIGSGMGGATAAAGLAPTGAKILVLERGARLRDSADARDARAIFQRGVFRPQETWLDATGQSFNPGNYYYVGGNTKLYGAVLLRYRAQDFAPDRASRRLDARLAVLLRGARALVHASGKALSGPWRAGLRPNRAASFGAVSFRAGSGRTRDRARSRADEGRRSASLSPASRRRHRGLAEARADALGRLSRHGDRQDGRRDLRTC